MAADAARKLATYEDVLNAPPNMIAEIIYGVLELQSRRAGPFDAVPLELANQWEGLPPVEEGR